MAFNALYFTIVISASIASGLKLNFTQDELKEYQGPNFPNFPVQKYVRTVQNVSEGPIAGYPKTPPQNALESGGLDDDLLPPLPDKDSNVSKSLISKRSAINIAGIDPATGYPLVADPSWKEAGGNEQTLQLPIEDFSPRSPTFGLDPQDVDNNVDPKTGYPLKAKEEWKYSGGDERILQPPLENESQAKAEIEKNFKTQYPAATLGDPNYTENFEAKKLVHDIDVNEKLLPRTTNDQANDRSYATGTDEVLGVPLLQESADGKVDPHTGYPLKAEAHWKDAGGNGDILQLPLDETTITALLNTKTEFPSAVEDSWKRRGSFGHRRHRHFSRHNGRSRSPLKDIMAKSHKMNFYPGHKNHFARFQDHSGNYDYYSDYESTSSEDSVECPEDAIKLDTLESNDDNWSSNNGPQGNNNHSPTLKPSVTTSTKITSAGAPNNPNGLNVSPRRLPKVYSFRSGKLISQQEIESEESSLTKLRAPSEKSVYYTGFGEEVGQTTTDLLSRSPEVVKEGTFTINPNDFKNTAGVSGDLHGVHHQSQPVASVEPNFHSNLHLHGSHSISSHNGMPSTNQPLNIGNGDDRSPQRAHLLEQNNFESEPNTQRTFSLGPNTFALNYSTFFDFPEHLKWTEGSEATIGNVSSPTYFQVSGALLGR